MTPLKIIPLIPINQELKAKIGKLGKKFDFTVPFYDEVNRRFAKDLPENWKQFNEIIELDGHKYKVEFSAKK